MIKFSTEDNPIDSGISTELSLFHLSHDWFLCEKYRDIHFRAWASQI